MTTMVNRFAHLKEPLKDIEEILVDLFKKKGIHLVGIYPTAMRKIITYGFQYEVPIEWSPFGDGRKDIRPWRELTKADMIEELLEAQFDGYIVEVDSGTTAKPVNDDKDWYVEARVFFLPRKTS
jgi:hypothetical protein